MEFTAQEIQSIAWGDPVKALSQINDLLDMKFKIAMDEWDRERREVLAILETIREFIMKKTNCDHQIHPLDVKVHTDNFGASKYEGGLKCIKCNKIWVLNNNLPDLPRGLSGQS